MFYKKQSLKLAHTKYITDAIMFFVTLPFPAVQ